MDDSRILPFTARAGRGSGDGHGGEPPPGEEESVEAGDAYATARGVKAPPALKFLHADGGLMTAMPYAYLPIVWGTSPELVTLEYPGFFTLLLAGRNLSPLEARLCEYRVTWIRQCTAEQAATLPTAVTRIEIVRLYPSRELA